MKHRNQDPNAIKDYPILFSDPMVNAILAILKNNTRRIANYLPEPPAEAVNVTYKYAKDRSAMEYLMPRKNGTLQPCTHYFDLRCPFDNKPGTHLWVREAWSAMPQWNDTPPRDIPEGETIIYRANYDAEMQRELSPWRPGIFLPRWASRILLEVVSIRLERLHDITEEDAKAEGVTLKCTYNGKCNSSRCPLHNPIPNRYRDAFAHLWDTIHGAGAWERNDWVWRVEFKVLSTTPTATTTNQPQQENDPQ